jgi:hypothetical protein
MNRALYRNAIIMLAAVIAGVLLHEVDRRAAGGLFEVDNPTSLLDLSLSGGYSHVLFPESALAFLLLEERR